MLKLLLEGKMTNTAFIQQILAQIAPWIVAIFVLCVVDLMSGIYAAQKRGENIISRRMRDSLAKLMLYFGTVIATLVIDIVVLDSSESELLKNFDIMYYICAFVCVVEFKSIIENTSFVTGNGLSKRLSTFFKLLMQPPTLDDKTQTDKEENDKK